MSDSLWPHGIYSPWNSPGQNTEVVSIPLLQGICPTQGSNPGLPHCRRILYQLSHKGSPRILEWVAYPFSSGSSQPRNWTGVSCIAGRFYTNWVTREAPTVVEFLSFSVCICYSPGFTYFTVILFSTKNLMMLMSSLWLVPFINIKEPFLSYLMPFWIFLPVSPLDLIFILPTQLSLCLHLPDKLCLSFCI